MVSRLPPPTVRPVQTRFRFGSAAERLNLADDGKSPDHYAKGTPSPRVAPEALIACRRVVSGSLSSPGRGSSHRSLALLFAIGRQGVLSLTGWAPWIQTRFHVSRPTQVPDRPFHRSPTGLSHAMVVHSRTVRLGFAARVSGPSTPPGRVQVVWADPLSLAATDGVAFAFFSSG